MDRSNNEIRIVLVGKTGTGKSSTGNTLLNRQEFEAKLQSFAVTRKSAFGERKLKDKKLLVVDTPGFFYTNRDKDEMNREILKSLGLILPGPNAVLYVMRIGDKILEEELHCIKILTNLFGEDICNFVIIVFTRGNDLERMSITDYIKDSPAPFKDFFRKCSNRMLALDNSGNDHEKCEAVNKLLAMIETMIYGQAYYSNDMLEKAKKACFFFLEKMKYLEMDMM